MLRVSNTKLFQIRQPRTGLSARFLWCAFCLLLLRHDSQVCEAGSWLQPGDWPQFRGVGAAGIADGQDVPVTWNVATGENIAWKTPIPGLGLASPIATRGRVFLVTATGGNKGLKVGLYGDIAPVKDQAEHSWRLICLSLHSGQILWDRELHSGVPAIMRHTKASHANCTPATDGARVVVSLGSEGLYCYDLCGNRCWKRDLGRLDSGFYRLPKAQWGFGSSPIIYRNMVIVQCDVQQGSYVAALDLCNGREIWRTARNEVPTWGTPTVCSHECRSELVLNGYRHTAGYDPNTGRELWKLVGGGDIPVPTPIFAHGLIYLSSAHGPKRPLRAIEFGATGDLTQEAKSGGKHIRWANDREGIYMQTPLVYGDLLYACRTNGVLGCFDAKTGELKYRERLGGGSTGFTASAVAANGRLYFTSENGNVTVVEAGPTFRRLAQSQMNDVCMSTPAISRNRLLIRTKDSLYAIGDQTWQAPMIVARNRKQPLARGIVEALHGLLSPLRRTRR